MANSNSSEHIRLKELGNSKFEVVKNESDIRGWTVKNGQGRILGKVSDLLFDIESEKVLYMVLDLEGNEIHLKDRKVLAPLNITEIHEAHQNVTFPGIMANELTELPTYEKGKVSTRIEDIVQHAFADIYSRSNSIYENSNPVDTSQNHFKTDINNSTNQYNTPNTSDKSRPQTVVGVFEHSNQGQIAIEYLLGHNFKRNQIELSSRDSEYNESDINEDDSSVTNWFKSLFGNDNDAKTYSEAAKTGCVVTVQTSSLQEAERAAEILDLHGALSVNDSLNNQQGNYRSRIIDIKGRNYSN